MNFECVSVLNPNDQDMVSFVMQSINMEAPETLNDLAQPECRAAFDLACDELSKSQMASLMKTPEGLHVLKTGQCLEMFREFQDFTMEDFALFPDLKLSSIRQWTSIEPSVLLSLINSRGYSSIGRVELFPKNVGVAALSDPVWTVDPYIWQLFLIEGVRHLPTDHQLAFARFLSNENRIEGILNGRSRPRPLLSTSSVRSPLDTCSAMMDNAGILSRWSIQLEEFMVSLLDSDTDVDVIREMVVILMSARALMARKIAGCDGGHLKLTMLSKLFTFPLTWRLRDALLHMEAGTTWEANITPMTSHLITKLRSLSFVSDFYRRPLADSRNFPTIPELFGYFLELNGAADLEQVFGSHEDSLLPSDDRIVLAISIRRILLLLLSPNEFHQNDLIQQALDYVFQSGSVDGGPQEGLFYPSENEANIWFDQARDLMAVPVLDRIIISFGHEFNVEARLAQLLSDPAARERMFTETTSASVRLQAALLQQSQFIHVPGEHQITVTFLDPLKAFLPEGNEVDNSGNAENIQTVFGEVVSFLRDCSNPDLESLAHFLEPRFRIVYHRSPGYDAGGLRRTWVSTSLALFGDPKRAMFPLFKGPGGGRVPYPLLDPQVMAWLGLLHGKALQVRTTPSWFFNHDFARLLFAPDEEEIDFAAVIPTFYPDLLFVFNLLIEEHGPADPEMAVDYFNESRFPTLLTALPRHSPSSAFEFSQKFFSLDRNYEGPRATVQSLDDIVAYRQALVALVAQNLQACRRQYRENLLRFFDPQFGNQIPVELWTQLLSPQPVSIAEIVKRISFNRVCETTFIIDDESSDQTPVKKKKKNSKNSSVAEAKAELTKEYSTSSSEDEKESETIEKSAVRAKKKLSARKVDRKMKKRLLAKLQSLRQSQMQSRAQAAAVDISDGIEESEILAQIEAIEAAEIAEAEEAHLIGLLEESKEELDFIESKEEAKEEEKDASLALAENEQTAQLKLISAKEAFKRILLKRFTTPEAVEAFLSFATGSPQLPPSGLEALSLQVTVKQQQLNGSAFSASHTCSSLIDFMLSERFSTTSNAFYESVFNSSGFGFA